ncbi:MAG: hypothetical protein WCT85_01605 [Parachlamydiales bacterium]|jgi:hypothetical protein
MRLINCLSIFFAFNLFADIQIVPVPSEPQPENVKIYIVFPEDGDVENESDPWIQLRLRGYPLGNMTETDRANEIMNYNFGQSIHILIDNNEYFARTGPSIAPFDEEGNYYESMYKFTIPYNLSKGKHYIRVFPTRSFGESLKEEGCFASAYFYIKDKLNNQNMSLKGPYVTYNEPSSYLTYKENQPVLLDFYLSNCVLSSDGFKVKITIDQTSRILTNWSPYYILGLTKGKHNLRLQLLDDKNEPVKGFFNDTARVITIR